MLEKAHESPSGSSSRLVIEWALSFPVEVCLSPTYLMHEEGEVPRACRITLHLDHF